MVRQYESNWVRTRWLICIFNRYHYKPLLAFTRPKDTLISYAPSATIVLIHTFITYKLRSISPGNYPWWAPRTYIVSESVITILVVLNGIPQGVSNLWHNIRPCSTGTSINLTIPMHHPLSTPCQSSAGSVQEFKCPITKLYVTGLFLPLEPLEN